MFVIPIMGKSSRFFDAGFTVPKFQLKISDDTVFSLAIRSFEKYFLTDSFIFIVRGDYGTPEFVRSEVERLGITDFKIKVLDHDTSGQAETVYLGLQGESPSEPVYIFNIDTFRPRFTKSPLSSKCDGYLEVFKGEGEHWSFVKPGVEKSVLQTTEKERISDLCSDGLYFFKTKKVFDETFQLAQSKQATIKGEYYVAPLYNYLIQADYDVCYELIDRSDVIFCGTPDEYRMLL